MVNIPDIKSVSRLENTNENEYLILLKTKEEYLVNSLCGTRYNRTNALYKRYKTSKKTIATEFGEITHHFLYVKHKESGEIFSPLLSELQISKYQHMSVSFKKKLVRKSGRMTYGQASEDILDSFDCQISRQSLWNYTQEICSEVRTEQEPNKDHRVLLADGSPVKSGDKSKHEVKCIMSIGDSFDDKVLLKTAINQSWSQMVSEINLKPYDVFVGDGEVGLAETFTSQGLRFHFCHEHAKRDLAFYLWKDGLCKKEYTKYVDEFKKFIIILQNSTKKHKRDKNWSKLAWRIRWFKGQINSLAVQLMCHGLNESSAFLRRNKDFLTTASELAVSDLEVPFTTNGIEILMKEVGKRTKKKSMYWSENGLKNILKMVLKRYFLPENRRSYKEVFTSNETEGIKS